MGLQNLFEMHPTGAAECSSSVPVLSAPRGNTTVTVGGQQEATDADKSLVMAAGAKTCFSVAPQACCALRQELCSLLLSLPKAEEECL